MIIRGLGKALGAPIEHLKHPKFEHFDRAVTLLVFIDLVPKIPHFLGVCVQGVEWVVVWITR